MQWSMPEYRVVRVPPEQSEKTITGQGRNSSTTTLSGPPGWNDQRGLQTDEGTPDGVTGSPASTPTKSDFTSNLWYPATSGKEGERKV